MRVYSVFVNSGLPDVTWQQREFFSADHRIQHACMLLIGNLQRGCTRAEC
jgi:hypothetical protein